MGVRSSKSHDHGSIRPPLANANPGGSAEGQAEQAEFSPTSPVLLAVCQ